MRDRSGALSGNGLVVAGTSGPAAGATPIYWTQTEGLNFIQRGFGTSPTSYPSGASTDGSVIVGDSGGQAYRWSQSNPVINGLGFLPVTFVSSATAVSADGSVIIGNSGDGAFRWTDGSGMAAIPGIPGEAQTRAYGISGDGSVVVGSSGTGTPGGRALPCAGTSPAPSISSARWALMRSATRPGQSPAMAR